MTEQIQWLNSTGWEARQGEFTREMEKHLEGTRIALAVIESYLTPSGFRLI
jgi:hypothetical protein